MLKRHHMSQYIYLKSKQKKRQFDNLWHAKYVRQSVGKEIVILFKIC